MVARLSKYSNEWRQREAVDNWRASGLSQAEFCRREGIPEWALSEWKRREQRRGTQRTGLEAVPTFGPRPKERNKLGRYWKRVVDEQVRSGLTVLEFCRKHGLAPETFKRWRRKLAGTVRQVKVAPQNPFVAVKLPSAPVEEPRDSEIEIVLPGGSKVKVTQRTSLDLLCRVLRMLEERC